MRRAALLFVLAAACAIPPAPERARSWPVETFFSARDRDFGGFNTSRLAVKAGEAIPWRPGATAASDAVVVQPAYADGAPAAYVVTEVWEKHPDLWVQPVYHFVKPFDANAPGANRTGADGVFGVGVDSTFYSPYWRLWWAEPGEALAPFKDVATIAAFPMHKGPVVVCPIVPDGVRVSGTTHPFTGEALQNIGIGKAYVNGQRVEYFDLGPNRQEVEKYQGDTDGIVEAADLYVFASRTADGARTPLEIPAVLPAQAARHAYVRRVDVVLATEAVFVPASRGDLRTALSGKANVPAADPLIPEAVASRYLMRVAKDGACFASAATFPGACEWLDSEEAIEAGVPENRIFETDVTLTAAAVQLP